jgi:hypothetical protein
MPGYAAQVRDDRRRSGTPGGAQLQREHATGARAQGARGRWLAPEATRALHAAAGYRVDSEHQTALAQFELDEVKR